MFALNIRSTFGDTIDCRINGKSKRVTWRDSVVGDRGRSLCDRSSRHSQVRRQLVGLRSARQPAARRLRGKNNFETYKRGCGIQKSLKSQLDLINSARLLSKPSVSMAGA